MLGVVQIPPTQDHAMSDSDLHLEITDMPFKMSNRERNDLRPLSLSANHGGSQGSMDRKDGATKTPFACCPASPKSMSNVGNKYCK